MRLEDEDAKLVAADVVGTPQDGQRSEGRNTPTAHEEGTSADLAMLDEAEALDLMAGDPGQLVEDDEQR